MLVVIIPTRNRPDQLKSCLEAIFKNSVLPDQIIIIDSSDFEHKIEDISANNRITYQTTHITSAAIQRNIGIDLVSVVAKYLAFLDDDVIIPSNYFSKLIDTLNSTGAIGVSGLAVNPQKNYVTGNNSPLRDLFSRFFLNNSKKNGVILSSGVNIPVRVKSSNQIKVQWLIGCALWNYNKIKLIRFEKDFFGQSLGEDVIFSLKASQHGSLYVDTSIEIDHVESKIMRPNSEEFTFMWIANRFRIVKTGKSPMLNLIPFHWANLGKFLQILFTERQDKKREIKGFFRGYKNIIRLTYEN
jgi:GT2 family glycosyltransferase